MLHRLEPCGRDVSRPYECHNHNSVGIQHAVSVRPLLQRAVAGDPGALDFSA